MVTVCTVLKPSPTVASIRSRSNGTSPWLAAVEHQRRPDPQAQRQEPDEIDGSWGCGSDG